MPFLQKPKCVSTPNAYTQQPKLTLLIESSFVSSSDPLLLELLLCSLSAIDGSRDTLCSRSSSISCSSTFLCDALVSTSPHVLLKFVSVPLPSIHICSFFLSFLHRLCFELLKLVPHFFFFQDRLWGLHCCLVPSCVPPGSPILLSLLCSSFRALLFFIHILTLHCPCLIFILLMVDV